MLGWRRLGADGEMALAAVERLNSRFADGAPSSDPARAGIVARAFDSSVQSPLDLAWVADNSIGGVLSASLLNRRAPYLFGGDVWHTAQRAEWGQVGVLLTPRAVRASLLCGFDRDASSRTIKCKPPAKRSQCVPGCIGVQSSLRYQGVTHPPFFQGWCAAGAGVVTNATPSCAWRPEQLVDLLARQEQRVRRQLAACQHDSSMHDGGSVASRLELASHVPSTASNAFSSSSSWACQCASRCCTRWTTLFPSCQLYNELILDADSLAALLWNDSATALEAIYFLEPVASASNDSAVRAEAAARSMHRAVSSSSRHTGVALVAMDVGRRRPFRLVER